MMTVSVVLETDSVHAFDNLTITDCLGALTRQDYPPELIELIAVDGGKVPALEQKNLGMVRTRQLEPDLRGSALIRMAGLGWPIVVVAKLVRDLAQMWQHRRRVGARLGIAVPLALVFGAALGLGGLAALLRLPAPRVS